METLDQPPCTIASGYLSRSKQGEQLDPKCFIDKILGNALLFY